MTADPVQLAEFVGGPKCGETMSLQAAHPALTFTSLRDSGRYVQTATREYNSVHHTVRVLYRWVPA